MTKEQYIQKLERQIELITHLKTIKSFSTDFKKWYRDTEILIERIFGKGTRHISDFTDIRYSLMVFSLDTPDYEFERAYRSGLDEAKVILESFIQEIIEYWEVEKQSSKTRQPHDIIMHLCERFHLVARQIRDRHADRETLNIEDEYDVQDLFHTLLTIYFDDIRAEEWTPSYAGSCSRVDFLLKKEQIVIEIKKTRKGLSAKEVGEQLLIDIQRYKVHPDCNTLICFVYDPDGRIANPRGIENDLNKEYEDITVKVIITPKGI